MVVSAAVVRAGILMDNDREEGYVAISKQVWEFRRGWFGTRTKEEKLEWHAILDDGQMPDSGFIETGDFEQLLTSGVFEYRDREFSVRWAGEVEAKRIYDEHFSPD